MATIGLTEIKVACDGHAADGVLVLHGDTLVAVLVCLAEDLYGPDRNRWYLEAGFGKCIAATETFADIAAALHWIAGRLDLEEAAIAPAIAAFRRDD